MDYEIGPSGEKVPHLREITEIASGLNRKVKGQWAPSEERIDILPSGGAAANGGQHSVTFPEDIYHGVIELLTPEGKHLKNRRLGLSLFDGTNSVLIAELTHSVGQLLSSGNQVVYANAFTDIQADLRYTYTRAGFEQDVVLRARLPDPADFGLNPATTRIQVLTEFFSPPQPTVKVSGIFPALGPALRNEELDFGMMRLGKGRAFLAGAEPEAKGIPVAKQWTLMEGRQFLIEEVAVAALADELQTLPQNKGHASLTPGRRGAGKVILPPTRQAKNERARPMQMMAKAFASIKGSVLMIG